MGCGKEEQPMFGKEGIRPAQMIEPAAAPAAPMTLAKDTAQAHTYPAVQRAKGTRMAVLEVRKPANQDSIDGRDDLAKAMTVATPCLDADGIFELFEALGPRPAHSLFEMITQKIEPAGSGRIDNPGLDRVHRKTGLGRPCLNQSQRPKRFSLRPTQNHKVIGIPHHLDVVASHQMVKGIKIDVG